MTREIRTAVTVSIDTEEDNWGSYEAQGATVENIAELPVVQDVFDRWGVRPTYLVNHPPLESARSVEILGRLGESQSVEIGAHCHPWNTPPFAAGAAGKTMMCDAPEHVNFQRIESITTRILAEVGHRPVSFRAGRWGFGPSVSVPLARAGYLVDASVSPFTDWSDIGGPDYTSACHRPYRFDPATPFQPDPTGEMVEIPVTVGYLRGQQRRMARLRSRLERSVFSRLRVVGLLDVSGVLTRRWLSPETTPAGVMIRLAQGLIRAGEPHLGLTFHSCALRPGCTPFVRDTSDRARFVAALDAFFRFCHETGLEFLTLGEFGRRVRAGDDPDSGPGDRGGGCL